MTPDYEKIAAEVEGCELPASPAPPASDDIPIENLAAAQQKHYPVTHEKYQGLAEEKGYDQSYARLQRMHYSHDAMVDLIIADPTIKQNQIASTFGRSVPWISRILGSDSFQAALAKRREELTDPFLVATIEERMKGLAMQSIDVLAEKLAVSSNADLALKALDISSKALGFGARGGGNGQQNNFTIVMPGKAVDAASWAEQHTPMKQLKSGTDG